MSDGSGNFNGDFIEIAPLLGFGISGYTMDAIIPCNQPQGAYSIRVTGDNPITVSDTISNVIVGALPNTDVAILGTYTYFNTQRYCEGDTARLIGPPPPLGETHSYQWFENGTPIPGAPGQADTLLVFGKSGVYSVEVTRGLCSAMSADTIINLYSPPAFITHTPDPAIKVVSNVGADSIQFCEGVVATLNAPAPFPADSFAYQWYTDSVDPFGNPILFPLVNDTLISLNTDSAGTYYVEVTSFPGGCIDTSEVFTVFVDTLPSTSIVNLSSVNLCLEDSVVLTALDTVAYPDWQYEWQGEFPLGSGNWISSTNDTMAYLVVDTALVGTADTSNFRLRITNETCEFFTNEITVVFIPDPVFVFVPGDSVAVCEGDSILVFAQGSGAVSYQWSNGKLGASIWITDADAGTVTCTAFGLNSCSWSRDLKVGIYQLNADAGPDQIIEEGESAQLQGSGGINYYWSSDFPAYYNDRNISNPLVRPIEDTTTFIMRITGQNGCVDYDTVRVFVRPETPDPGTIFQNVQNVITPNGDGKNDFLDLSEIIQTDDCLVSILDRWGREVYRQTGYQGTWNGTTTGGEQLPDGTYYYILQCGDEIRYKGPVTIIRNQN